MLKITLGLIIAFGLLACKLPDVDDSDETNNDEFKSTHSASKNLSLAINIEHEKSVYNNKQIEDGPIEFSIELLNELGRSLEVIESGGDSLQFYINETSQLLKPIKCAEPLFGLYEHVCKYTYSYKFNGVIDESLNIRVTLTRRNNEILAVDFNVPAPIKLLEPHIPFDPILPNGTAILSWQSETPMQLQFLGGTSECNAPDEAIVLGEQDTYFSLSPDYFLLSPECGEYVNLLAILSTYKEWNEIDENSFNNVNIFWADRYRVFLLGHE